MKPVIILTAKEDAKKLYIVSDKIVLFDEHLENGLVAGSRVVFDSDFAYLVLESPMQIMKQLHVHGCH